MSDPPVVLILGSGPRVGASVAKMFAANGYSVALASRSASNSKTVEGYLSVSVDLSEPASVPVAFEAVKAEFKVPPSVVVYNAGAFTSPPNEAMFELPVQSVIADLNVNSVSAYVAAQEAVKGWKSMGKETKVFIYTGNMMNQIILPMPAMTTLGMGKSASAYWIGAADTLHSSLGYRLVGPYLFYLNNPADCFPVRFFYADERNDDGSMKGMQIDGQAHAEFFMHLGKGDSEVPWHATFVKGKGYVKF